MKQTPRQLANLKDRHREKRPGVQSADRHCTAEEGIRYLVVTQGARTYHETFEEAAEEFRLRRGMA